MGKGKVSIPSDYKKAPTGFISIKSTRWALKMMKVDIAHEKGIKGQGITVAVGDTGLNWDHPNLPHPQSYYQGTHPTEIDQNGHGSHVLGIAYSVLPESNFIVGKIADARGEGDYDQMTRFGYWAVDNGAKVISLSLGGPNGSDDKDMDEFIEYAYSKGVILVAAAGNEQWKPNYPASHPKVWAVSAIDHNSIFAEFNNVGADFAAPGVNIHSAYKGTSSQHASGSSQATPYVAGAAGLIIAEYYMKYGVYPSPEETFSIAQINAKDLGDFGFDKATGHGMIQANGDSDAFLHNTDDVVADECPRRNFWQALKIYLS